MNDFSDQVFSRLLDRPESERGGGANEDGASVASVLLDAAGPYPDSKGVHGSLQHDELMNFMFAGTGFNFPCLEHDGRLRLPLAALGASCLPVPCLGPASCVERSESCGRG